MNSIEARIARLRGNMRDEWRRQAGEYMTARQFSEWLDKAKRGDTLVYHTGNLHFDRQNNSSSLFRVYHRLANVVWQAFELGQVTLVQRRVEEGVCSYEAQRL